MLFWILLLTGAKVKKMMIDKYYKDMGVIFIMAKGQCA